jgi:hypothetical protein
VSRWNGAEVKAVAVRRESRRLHSAVTSCCQAYLWTNRAKCIIAASTKKKLNSWLWSASQLYRPSDRSLLAKLVPTFADRACRVVSATDSHGRQSRFSRPEP